MSLTNTNGETIYYTGDTYIIAKPKPTEASEMLSRIVASLQQTRWNNGQLETSAGGDISVMNEVNRIAKEAFQDGINVEAEM